MSKVRTGLLATVTILLLSAAAHAATFTVTKTADTNDGACNADCSLREAIVAANANAGADTVSVPAGTYTLSIGGTGEDASATGDLDITDDLTLTGAGAATTAVDGGGIDHVIQILSAIVVDISDMTIQGGSSGGIGGIQNSGVLSVSNTAISGNGGIGIFTGGAGSTTVTNSTISGNFGAGFQDVCGATTTITNSTVSGNINTSVFSGGGGISTIATVIVTNSTISGNTATLGGGGIFKNFVSPCGPVTLTNTIVAHNVPDNCFGVFTSPSNGNNLDNDGSCVLTQPGDLSNVSTPGLILLQNNGGPTDTHALASGSPAIDAGDDASCPATDQRGQARADGDGDTVVTCDIGAFEFQGVAPPPVASLDHYKCWKVKDLKNPKFEKIKDPGISLDDQFGSDADVDVLKPFFVCNPADKNGSGIIDPTAHQCCYKIKGQKPPPPRPRVEIADQFGTLQLEALKPQVLCQPCTKTLLP